MAQAETEKRIQMLWGAALSRAVCTIAELGIADQIARRVSFRLKDTNLFTEDDVRAFWTLPVPKDGAIVHGR